MDNSANFKSIPPNVTTDSKHNIVLYGLSGLGSCILSLGIISMVASNWDAIKPSIKLVVYFILQISLGLGYLKISATRNLVREIILHVFAIGFLAGIGLISQIFQLSGGDWEPLAFWLLLTFAAALVTERSLLIHLWWIVFFIMLRILLPQINTPTTFRFPTTFRLVDNIYMAIILCLIAIGFSVSNPNSKIKLSNNFVTIGIKYDFFILMLYASIVGTILCYFSNLVFHVGAMVDRLDWLYFSSLIAICSIYFNTSSLKQSAKQSLIALVVIITLFSSLPIYFTFMHSKIWGALWFILLWICFAWNCILLSYKYLYRLAIIIVMLRFIIIYIEIFRTLLLTGIGLTISGLLFLLLAFLWYKYQTILLSWIEHE